MVVARFVAHASKLEPLITNDLLMARAILCHVKDPAAQKLDEARTHLGSLVHGVHIKPVRDYADKDSVLLIAAALREAADAVGAYERTYLSDFFPHAQNEEIFDEATITDFVGVKEKGENKWVVFIKNRTASDLADDLRRHAAHLDKLLIQPYCIKTAPIGKRGRWPRHGIS
jgi:hypothetical protein